MATPFRAVYGRVAGSSKYSKDFHQIAVPAAQAMERAFGIERRGQTPIKWIWPGGERGQNSQFKPASADDTRSRLHWPFGQSPDPWRLTPSTDTNTLQVITGEPGEPGVPMPSSQEAIAETQRERVESDGERPWYLAVHLWGDGPVLHARTYLENPKPEHEFASWNNVPERVRQEMTRLRGSGDATGFVEFEEGGYMSIGRLADEILRTFKDNPNVLLVGPPGTGKTVAMEQVRALYNANLPDSVTFDTESPHEAFGIARASFDGEQLARSIVFHPSYSYENFVMGLLPDLGENGSQVIVRPHVGPLLEMAHFASSPGRRALLIVDEFNRAPASAVFGDTIALLDVDKRAEPGHPEGGAKIVTPYAHLDPKTADGDALSDETTFPSTLFILAAMNSADRSVAPLDAALRRRFSIIHVDPDYEALAEQLGVSEGASASSSGNPAQLASPQDVKRLAIAILKALNRRIEMIEGRDFLLGQSVFWKVDGEDRREVLMSLAVALDNRVVGTLALNFLDNDDALAAVLNVSADVRGGMQAAEWIYPDPSIAGIATRRLRLVRFQSLDEGALITALFSLL